MKLLRLSLVAQSIETAEPIYVEERLRLFLARLVVFYVFLSDHFVESRIHLLLLMGQPLLVLANFFCLFQLTNDLLGLLLLLHVPLVVF